MKFPDFSFEIPLWERGYSYVIGVDEVGRGAFAGPLIAAAAAIKIFNFQFSIFKKNEKLIKYILGLGINDSKKLTAKKREELGPLIRKYFHVGIGEASVVEINNFGIVKATEKAMRRAVYELQFGLDPFFLRPRLGLRAAPAAAGVKKRVFAQNFFLLIDAFHVKYISGVGLANQKAIIGGDGKSISIAAASIVAKVYRDKLMATLGRGFVQYGWGRNKGYGTKFHQEGIRKNGLCEFHRRDFVDKIILQREALI